MTPATTLSAADLERAIAALEANDTVDDDVRLQAINHLVDVETKRLQAGLERIRQQQANVGA